MLILVLQGVTVTLPTGKPVTGVGLVADNPIMRQIALGYMLPVAIKKPEWPGLLAWDTVHIDIYSVLIYCRETRKHPKMQSPSTPALYLNYCKFDENNS